MEAIRAMSLMYEPLSLNAVVGLPRRGKTAFAILLALQAWLRGARIYSNVWIHDEDGNDLRDPEGRLDSEDPGECLSQLSDIFLDIKEKETWFIDRFLVLDEFSSIADSQRWKEFSWTSDIWKQLGKLGFTGVAIDQNFSRIYNGYRDLVTYKYIVGNTDVNGDRVSLPYCAVIVGQQSANDHAMYSPISDFPVNLKPVFKFYNTHELMYFGKSKKKSR
ncbi:MAG: hypothetical protein OIN84_00900 [Candidatus Methanoperedens sp.]|nr:MAG: hypothetical protein F9K14_03210 [Candidatus Methanoperedens sp.]MBZ0175239.1 type IV secretory system conjugative DNA transfer family protein [Candidatus Methanoperedens nitroreducens]MCX9076511.1 hypothetical protein [Candidatus Methanoperedens sp.]